MQKKWVEVLATGFYFGRSPIMPGTFGTLWGLPIALILAQGSPIFYMVAAVILLLFAVFVAQAYEGGMDAHDPSEVVIDEIVGYVIAFTWLPLTWQAFLAAFLAFRFFDILKPFPINYIDSKIQGGLGTVLDDVAAGIFANILLQFIYSHTPWLGAQLHVR